MAFYNHTEYEINDIIDASREFADPFQTVASCIHRCHQIEMDWADIHCYTCQYLPASHDGSLCQQPRANPVDAQIVQRFFPTIEHTAQDAWAYTRPPRQKARSVANQTELQEVERLRCQALLAEHRYNCIEPSTRMTAAKLEQQWLEILRNLHRAEDTSRYSPNDSSRQGSPPWRRRTPLSTSKRNHQKSGSDAKVDRECRKSPTKARDNGAI
jgi:hypothetical protein